MQKGIGYLKYSVTVSFQNTCTIFACMGGVVMGDQLINLASVKSKMG